MRIIPAIDILGGQCVRLEQGKFRSKKVYSSDPLAMAQKFEAKGATMLHIVDLDAAKTSKPVNQMLIIGIVKTLKIPIEVGGGIRDLKTAEAYLNSDVQRVIIGTKALTDPVLLTELIGRFGSDRIVVAIEIKRGKIVIQGWQATSGKDYMDFARELKLLGVTEILFTDVERDGSLTEPNFIAIKNIVELGFNVIASGGVSDLAAIKQLKKMGVASVILGKALYEKKIVFKDALNLVKINSNLTKRVIPCLDVRDGKVVKGFRFRDHVVMGDIVNLAKYYSSEGADELVFYDITASVEDRTVSVDWVKKVSAVVDIPFCVAGGIRSVEDARNILQSGADKVSINSPALENPDIINKLVSEFGSQAIVIGIDSLEKDGEYLVKQYTGDPSKTQSTQWRTFDWALEVQSRGAGEIVLNCMNQDGVRQGYDIDQLKKLHQLLRIPLIASGGAGTLDHFKDVFLKADVDGALAASVFHSGAILISQLKMYLLNNGIPVRI